MRTVKPICLGLTLLLSSFSAACGPTRQVMVNPNTGTMMTCVNVHGTPIQSRVYENCVHDNRTLGYVEIEKAAGTGFGVSDRSEASSRAVVAKVFPNSPAAKAGMRTGDIVIERNGEKITCIEDLLSQKNPAIGQKASCKVLRGEQVITFDMIAVPITNYMKKK